MKNLVLSLAMIAGACLAIPSTAQAQFVRPFNPQRLAERQVIQWFQAYLNRLPNAQELAVLTNQYMLSGNALYVQSVILSSNEFYRLAGNTPYGFLNRLFVLTIGRTANLGELASLQNQVIYNGRLWFVQNYLAQISGGAWNLNAWNAQPVAVPVPVVVPVITR